MTAPATGTVPTPAPTDEQVQSLLSKIFSGSNWKSEIEKTVRRNVRLLADKKDLQAQIEALKTTGAAPAGGKVLTKEQAADYDAFVALNVKPADLKVVVDEHGKFKVKVQETEDAEKFAAAAKALGFGNVKALTRWLQKEKLVVEFKDTRVDDEETGKKVVKKMPYVRPAADEKAQPEPLEEYMDREVPEFVELFRTVAEPEGGEEESETDEERLVRATTEAEERVRGGVRIAATRPAGAMPAASKDKKTLERIEQENQATGLYSF